MNKLRLLILLEIFIKYSDENHYISLKDIMYYLENKGISVERKVIYNDIKLLNSLGYEIEIIKGKIMKYHLLNHPIESVEAKLIYDSLNSMNFISKEKTNKIIDSIFNQISIYQKKKIIKNSYIPNKTILNKNFLYILDSLQNAIENDKYVSFKYFDITLGKNKQYRKQKSDYTLIPYSLVLIQQNYYCIFYSEHYKSFSNYRVDRIDELQILEKQAIKIPFEIDKHIQKSFNMFSGLKELIKVEFKNDVFHRIVDKFGYDFTILEKKENSFIASFNISVSNSFFSWITQFGEDAIILSPKNVVDDFKSFLNTLINMYK